MIIQQKLLKLDLMFEGLLQAEIENIVNEQINKEFYSGYLYLSMSAHLKELGLNGFAKWTRIQAKEEVQDD